MHETVRGAALGGILYGMMAGAIFLLAQVFAAMLVGESPFAPVQPFSSTVLGESVIGVEATVKSVVVGFTVHFLLSGLFGAIYCVANTRVTSRTQTDYGRQAALGMLFGSLIFLVNIELIARIFYPWFLRSSELQQWLLHALTYGLPLALFYAGARRRDPADRTEISRSQHSSASRR